MKVNGWTLYWHRAFREKFESLLATVQAIEASHPVDLATNGHAKLLKRIVEIISVEMSQDPDQPNYMQENTLGKSYRNWRRAKFFQRFRLFFRFSSEYKIIIFTYENDKNTLRQVGAKNFPYTVFGKRSAQGDPPDDWDDLLKSCTKITTLPIIPKARAEIFEN